MTDTSSIRINLSTVRLAMFNSDEEFMAKYDQVVDDTVIPFLLEAGLRPDNTGGNVEEWTDAAQTVLTWLCMRDERIEKLLFAALHDHMRAVVNQQYRLTCNECGEVFDDVEIAYRHDNTVRCDFEIMPVDEAM